MIVFIDINKLEVNYSSTKYFNIEIPISMLKVFNNNYELFIFIEKNNEISFNTILKFYLIPIIF